MRCYMRGCKSDSNINNNVFFFKFPTDLEIQNLWKNICKLRKVGEKAWVCSLHFKTCDIFQKDGQICLVKTALPISFESNDEAAKKVPSSGNVVQKLESTVFLPGAPEIIIHKKQTEIFAPDNYQCRFIIKLPEPNVTAPSIKSVAGSKYTQTNTNLCGSVEISECLDEYRLNCFYCCETFLLEKWQQFVDHLKTKHFNVPNFPNCDHDYTTVQSGTSNILKSPESIKNATRTCIQFFPSKNLKELQTIAPTFTSDTESEGETESNLSPSCSKGKQAKSTFSSPSNDEYVAKNVVQQTLRNIRNFEAIYKTVKTKPPRDIYLGRQQRAISSGVCYVKNMSNSKVTQKQTPLNRCLKRTNTETNEILPETKQIENYNHAELVFEFTPKDIINDLLDNIKEYPVLWEVHKEPDNEDYDTAIKTLCTQINEKWSLNLSGLQMRSSINRILAFYRFMLPCSKVKKFKDYYDKCSEFLPKAVKDIAHKRCTLCDICYASAPELKRHLIKVHQYLKWQYKCDYCSERFMDSDEFELHKILPHYIEVHRCNKCNAQLTSYESYRRHIAKCFEPPRIALVSTNKTPSKLSKQKNHKCHICEKEYTQKFYLNVHLKTHRKEFDFVCEICGKAFVKRASLTEHMHTHTGEKITCNICNLKMRKISLSRHLRLVHVPREGTIESTFRAKSYRYKKFSPQYTRPKIKRSKETGPRKYDCKKCDIHFPRLKLLKDHNNIIHCNQERVHCRICNFGFRHRSSMLAHYRSVHKLHSVQIMKLDLNEDLDKVLNLKIEELDQIEKQERINLCPANDSQLNNVPNLSNSIQDEIMKAIENIEKEEIKTDDGSMNDFLSDILKH